MNKPVTSFALAAGLAFALAGCEQDVIPDDRANAADVLAEDSTLNLAVMNANADSMSLRSDTPVISETPSQSAAARAGGASARDGDPGADLALRPATGSRSTASSESDGRVAAGNTPGAMRSRSTIRRTTRTRRTALNRRSLDQRKSRMASGGSTGVSRRSATTRRRSAALTSRSRSPNAARTPLTLQATVPAGWELSLASDNRVCTNTNAPGDRFTAHLTSDVVGPLGVVMPKGTIATGVVSSVRKGRRRNADIDVRVVSLTHGGRTYPVASDVTQTETQKVRTRSTGGDAGKVAAGAGVGAVAGQVIGGTAASTVIGAAAGALGGSVLASRARRYEECVPDGGRITARLTEPLTIAYTDRTD